MKTNKEISRREFSKNLAKLLLFGGLTHFAMPQSANAAVADSYQEPQCLGGKSDHDACITVTNGFGRPIETDVCPGGRPLEDVCNPEQRFADECPGEQMPEDECSPLGARMIIGGLQDDYCETGLSMADICAPRVLCPRINEQGRPDGLQSPDQCPAQNASTDVCEPDQTSEYDYCRTGLSVDDECAPNGGNETDECPGGGVLRDNCATPEELWGKGAGDECSRENHPEGQDSCKTQEDRKILGAEVADHCGFDLKKGVDASDVCYEGTNAHGINIGGTDLCIAGKIGTHIYGDGSDDCHDGSNEQDDCGVWNTESGTKEVDVCIVTKQGDRDDLCSPGLWDKKKGGNIGSDDVCYHGLPSSDECKPETGDKDECPGGGPDVDECYTGMPEDDECPGGKSDADVCFALQSETDECVKYGSDPGEDNEPPGEEDFAE